MPDRSRSDRRKVTYAVHPSVGKFDRANQSPKEYIFPDYDYIPPGTFAVIPWYYMIILFVVHVMLSVMGPAILYFRMWETWMFIMYYSMIGGLGVTAGAHRLWSHRSYKARLPLKLFLAMLQTSTGFDTIYNWSAIHRVHHRYSDTDADPHNVRRGFWHAHTWWMLMKPHPAIARAHETIDTSDLQADPIVYYQHKFYWFWYGIFGIGVPIWVPWYFWNTPLWLGVIFYFGRTVGSIHFASFVNSAAHMFGDRPYNENIMPSDNVFISWIANGEGFHNYHHTFPYDYATSEFGFINLTKLFIDGFAKLGLAYDLKRASKDIVAKSKQRTISAKQLEITGYNETDYVGG